MRCFYCDRIERHVPTYAAQAAVFDLASEAPRCPRHWRMLCGRCGHPDHFMAVAYCPDAGQLFCRRCAIETREVPAEYWGYAYYIDYRSPWSSQWCPALDRLEFEGRSPLTGPEVLAAVQAPDVDLPRYPPRLEQWAVPQDFSEGDCQVNWNRNALRWDALYDDDGDRNRRYQSDEPMLEMLGEVAGRAVLDVGSGAGYLCRKLARQGARMTGVELSDEFLRLAREREAAQPLGITYIHGSVARMDFLPAGTFAKAVSNYVLMDVRDYEAAVAEVFRVLQDGGTFVAVLSHPAFGCGPSSWLAPCPDSPRTEDRTGFIVDDYFRRGPTFAQWGDLDPVLSFHRPLRDYWRAFQGVGFRIDDFEEPSITARGRRELPPSRIQHTLRVPWSCIFRLVKP
jgi:SAM-dependent methyltransferase